MDWREYIGVDAVVLDGKPVVKGTRIGVDLLLDRFADGWTQDDILEAYPRLTSQQIQAAMAFAAAVVRADCGKAFAEARE